MPNTASHLLWDAHFGEPDAAHALAVRTLASDTPADESTRAWAELTIAYHQLFFTPRPVDARRTLDDAWMRFRSIGDERGEILAQTGIARILLIEQQPLAARELLLPLYPRALSLLPPQDRFWVVNALGATFFYTDNLDEAIRYLYEALEALRAIPPSPQLATVMSNLSAALVTVGDFEPARELAHDALELLPRYNNAQLMLFARSNLAEASLGVGDRAGALATVDAIFADRTLPARRAAQGHYCAIAAETYALFDRLDDAERCVQAARDIHADHPGGFNEVHWRWAAAALAAARDTGAGALGALGAAAEAAEAAHHLPTLCKAHAELARRYAALGRYEQAYRHQQRLLDAQTKRLRSRASARYYLLKVEHELTHVRVERDRAERERQESEALNRTLERLNRELVARMREIEKLQAQLATEAVHDSLTQLFNRRYLDSTLPGLLGGAARRDTPLALALVDLDHFKRINDRFGHPAGDTVLVQVAKLLGSALRPADVVARYGGEEFCIVLPDTDGGGALVALGMLAQKLRLLDIVVDGESLGPLTFSAGVAVFPHDGEGVATLVAAADRALYAAKRRGRDRIVLTSAHAARAA
jgi:diguanylate cyclase (GGDEF)-like protein